MQDWKCPICGGPAVTGTKELAATVIEGTSGSASRALAMGVDLGPPMTRERPVAYDLTFGCPNGHDTYIRTENVG